MKARSEGGTRPSRSAQQGLERLRIKHLRLLDVLIELGSARKAAERLHLSQPAVSQMLKELEDAFGGALFKRTRVGLEPYPRAHAVLRRVRPVLGELAAAHGEMLAPSTTQLRIGANLQFLTQLLPHALAGLRSRWPELRFVLREGPTTTLVEALLAGALDCTIGRLAANVPRANDLQYWPISGGELCLVVGRAHPLARRKRVTLEDLAGYAWALGGASGEARKLVEQLFVRAGLTVPQPVVECRPQFANLAFAGAMQLVTVATRRDAEVAERDGTIQILPVDLPVESSPVAFICRKSSAGDVWLTRLREALTAD